MSNTFDKLSILDSFIEEVNSYLPQIETNLERLTQSPADMDALEETSRFTHTIGGAASMMDFPGLAHVAHGMEDILGDALDGLTVLDDATLGLLKRSLGRLHQLLAGVHSGIDEEAVIAEDDNDYARYRAMIEPMLNAQQTDTHEGLVNGGNEGYAPVSDSYVAGQLPASSAYDSSLPSFDEVLASFRTPVVLPDEEVAWPEEPLPANQFGMGASPQLQETYLPQGGFDNAFGSGQSAGLPDQPSSALDALVASTRQPTSALPPVGMASPSYILETPGMPEMAEETAQPMWAADYPVTSEISAENRGVAVTPAQGGGMLPAVYEDMQRDADILQGQTASLRSLVTSLRSAMSLIDVQRSEFKGFLNGSKDALDRMEDWAGQAMGLNLRNSPDQVRRYLPLSVMWVANSKLKKVMDLLDPVLGGVELTDEQMTVALQQLQASIIACGETLQQTQTMPMAMLRQDPGWSAWEMQIARDNRDNNNVRERVTFERQGDPAALRAEIEAQVREEMQQEYESRPSSMTLALRTELEQQIRNEIRQEFEENRRLQERVVGPESEALRDLESRLRNDIEIQVRQEFLSQITKGGIDALQQQQQQNVAPQERTSTTSFSDRARETTGVRPGMGGQKSSVSLPPVAPIAPKANITISSAPANPPAPRSAPRPQQTQSMAAANTDFGEEAAEIFRMEAEEHLQTISMHVAALEKDPGNLELIQGVRRATHTLKGAAGMMGFQAIADLSHVSEDLLDSIMEGTTAISSPVLSLILDTAETLDLLITGRGESASEDEARVNTLRVRYMGLLGEQSPAFQMTEEDLDVDDTHDDLQDPSAMVSSMVNAGQANGTAAQRTGRGDLNVRVRLQKLDELVNLFGELLVNRSVLEERLQRLSRLVSDVGVSSNRLRDVGQKLESRFEAATLPSGRSVQVMPGEGNQGPGFGSYGQNGHSSQNGNSPAHLEEFDELELDRYTEFHQLARGLSEGISDMATLSTEMDAVIRESESVFTRENRLNTTFQDRLMKVRLVPLATMAPRLYRAARAVALKQHKEFEFLLEGEDTEVDRTVFEEISGPLLHLMRNAVNHALETPEVRESRGKSPVGQIKLSAGYEGNQVVITVRDDGIGLDQEHIRSVAISRGLIRPNQMLNESDLIDLIFRPGFSTAEVLSEESGRGVGLDVVRDSVSRLRGTMEVESMPGQGTAFTMKFPTSLAIQSAMMVRVSGQQFAIPTALVETIGRLDNYKRTTLGGQPAVNVNNEVYPLTALSQFVALPVSALDDRAPLLFINNGGQRIALVVDDIRGKFDIVMKNLGPHLRNVHGVAGATVLGNGQVVLILELSRLLDTRAKAAAGVLGAGGAQRRDAIAPAQQARGPVRQSVDVSTVRPGTSPRMPAVQATRPERGKHILVVDDSPSVRRVVSTMLKQHNWEVQMARDGVEALEMISYETPAAVLLDIEMPRMDGYELISTVRAQDQYRTLPLVVLTSRAASKHQQRAMQLGASAYVVKPYQDEELLNTLNALVYGGVMR
jgi:chemotaxis protein histidine kinase CheA/ActR/RegA family two-component response regulator